VVTRDPKSPTCARGWVEFAGDASPRVTPSPIAGRLRPLTRHSMLLEGPRGPAFVPPGSDSVGCLRSKGTVETASGETPKNSRWTQKRPATSPERSVDAFAIKAARRSLRKPGNSRRAGLQNARTNPLAGHAPSTKSPRLTAPFIGKNK